jgi:hypothetical protein
VHFQSKSKDFYIKIIPASNFYLDVVIILTPAWESPFSMVYYIGQAPLYFGSKLGCITRRLGTGHFSESSFSNLSIIYEGIIWPNEAIIPKS